MIRRIVILNCIMICILSCLIGLSACASGPEEQQDADSLRIVTTIFPEYDWTRTILGENPGKAELVQLLDSGADPHSFQPTARDMMEIADCDIFIYVGGASDEWVGKALRNTVNEDMTVVNLMEALGNRIREEEITQGMSEEKAVPGIGEDEETEYDEHVWLSLANARFLSSVIEEAIAAADPSNAEVYEANLQAYQKEIDALDEAYRETVDAAPVKTLVFGDRFPFRYLTDEYGLTYYAAFPGCSSETEASFETIRFLAEKLDELGLHAICTIEGSDHRIAETIVRSTKTKDQKILTMDSMQSVTGEEVAAGATWLSIMTDNLKVLKEALK